MLHLLDDSLEAFLRAEVDLDGIAVSFDPPDKAWSASVSRPAVNMFLRDVRRNRDESDAGHETVRDADGRRSHRPPSPRVSCRYLITAWGASSSDEHHMLGDILTAFLLHPEVGEQHLKGAYVAVRPVPTITVSTADGKETADFWSALGGQLKPGIDITVNATVYVPAALPVGTAVDRYTVTTRSTGEDAVSERDYVGGHVSPDLAGRLVTSPRGSGRIQSDGTFSLLARTGDDVQCDDGSCGVVPAQGSVELTPPGAGRRGRANRDALGR